MKSDMRNVDELLLLMWEEAANPLKRCSIFSNIHCLLPRQQKEQNIKDLLQHLEKQELVKENVFGC